jgi:hypothetical protein
MTITDTLFGGFSVVGSKKGPPSLEGYAVRTGIEFPALSIDHLTGCATIFSTSSTESVAAKQE